MEPQPLYAEPPLLKIRQINFEIFTHATESSEKILSYLATIVEFSEENDNFHQEQCFGTHGQRIETFSLQISRQKEIKTIMEFLKDHLTSQAKQQLDREISERLDEKWKFYFRVDKQAALLGSLRVVSHSDVIKIVIAIQNKNPKAKLTVNDVRSFFHRYDLL